MAFRGLFRKGLAATRGLQEKECATDPFLQFDRWFAEARKTSLAYPEAMALATATPDGAPSVRMVLLKEVDERGFCFFTNYESRKGMELAGNPRAALLFYWEPFERQVRIEGAIEKLTEEESFAYFQTRPRGSRIGAWASQQSAVIKDRAALQKKVDEYSRKFPGNDVPLPPYWGGFRCIPETFEFWQGRVNRLHDRLVFARDDDGWKRVRISP
jgi:pyridoxamine 5'-phosphate oxidase